MPAPPEHPYVPSDPPEKDPHNPISLVLDLLETSAGGDTTAIAEVIERMKHYNERIGAEGGLLWTAMAFRGRFVGSIEMTKAAYEDSNSLIAIAAGLRNMAALLEEKSGLPKGVTNLGAAGKPRDMAAKIADAIAKKG